MFYSLVCEVESSSDHWDSRGHYTEEEDLLCPDDAIALAVAIGSKVFQQYDIDHVAGKQDGGWSDTTLRQVILDTAKEKEVADQITADEIEDCIALLGEAIQERDVSIFNDAVWAFGMEYKEWWDANGLGTYEEILSPECWEV